MAKTTLNPVFESFSKKIGNLVFYTRDGKPYVRKNAAPTDRKSEKQIAVRNTFRCVVDIWKGAGGVVREAWKQDAKKLKKSGYIAFMGTNTKNARSDKPLELCREFGEKPLATLAASAAPSAGQAQCTFILPVEVTDRHVTFFVHEKLNGGSSLAVTRFDAGANPVSPYVISGLVSGKTYTIHGVVTDRAYTEAQTVSASVSCECAVS